LCIFDKVRKSFGFCFGLNKKQIKTRRFRYVHGGKLTPVCSRVVLSSVVIKHFSLNRGDGNKRELL
tara:strand:+ start:924 stop:1121 length:198 start_codon:yes stop_codon:yes gene_type:complete